MARLDDLQFDTTHWQLVENRARQHVWVNGQGDVFSLPLAHNQPDHPFRGTIVFVRFVRPTSSHIRTQHRGTSTRSMLPSHPFEYEYEYRFTEYEYDEADQCTFA
jgi:hypothetical protein